MRFAILLDVDGTLIDSLADIAHHLNEVRHFYGLEQLPKEKIRTWIGKGAAALIKGSSPEIDPKACVVATARYLENYRRTPVIKSVPYPGVVETLEYFQSDSRFQLAVVTNKSTPVAELTLKKCLPTIHFEKIVGPESVSEKKPSPKHLLEALQMIGADRASSCYIGDDPVDLECAEAAGVRFFAATYGYGGVDGGVEKNLKNFSELRNALLQKISSSSLNLSSTK